MGAALVVVVGDAGDVVGGGDVGDVVGGGVVGETDVGELLPLSLISFLTAAAKLPLACNAH